MNTREIHLPKIPPVLILSTGRCGSTMVSEMLNLHPRVLSLSEFFVPLGSPAFAWQNPDGERMWNIYSQQNKPLHSMLKDGHVVSEGLYPHGQPGSRYRAENMPPLIIVTLPHLTNNPEALFDELEPLVRAQPRRPLAEHYRFLFGCLAEKFQRDVWVERSGGSLMHARKLLHLFPEARVIHVYRDGRETAMSMSQHHNFKVLLGAILKCRRFGLDPSRDFLESTGSPFHVWLQDRVFGFLDSKKLAEPGPTLADMGRFWSELILLGDKGLGGLPADKLLNVKFEDIQQSPREELRRLIRFIDPSLEEESWLDQASATIRPTRSKFTSLPPAEQRALTEACKPGLELLGYPL
jgi:hypothetical protein